MPDPVVSEDVYNGLRSRILELDPASIGLERSAEVWGGMMELGLPAYTATIVALADGTTSIYTSTGGAMLGGEAHDAVRVANLQFLGALEAALEHLSPDPDAPLPATGEVTLRALTWDGRLAITAGSDQELGEGGHPLADAFVRGQDVITQMRVSSPEQG